MYSLMMFAMRRVHVVAMFHLLQVATRARACEHTPISYEKAKRIEHTQIQPAWGTGTELRLYEANIRIPIQMLHTNGGMTQIFILFCNRDSSSLTKNKIIACTADDTDSSRSKEQQIIYE